MFSFAPSDQQQNTPFFSDNQEKPSIFNSQFTQQQSAFQLFNSSNGHSSNNEYNYLPNMKDNAKQSKKSIIMELDQFDRKEIFKQLGTFHMMDDDQKQSKSRGLVESRVRKFSETQVIQGDSSAVFKESRLSKVDENGQNRNGNDRLKMQNNLNRSNQFECSKATQKTKQGTSMNSKPKLIQKFNLKKANINGQSLKIAEPESQPETINYQNSRHISCQQNSRPSTNIRNWQQQFSNNRKLEKQQQVGNKMEKKSIGNIFLNTNKQREVDKVKVWEEKSEKNLVVQQDVDLKQPGSKIIMPTFQAKPKFTIDLKNSRVQPAADFQKDIKQKNSVSVEDKLNRNSHNRIEVPMLSVEKEKNASNQKSLTKFADILRRSMARSEVSQQKINQEKKVTGLKGIQMHNFGVQLNKKTIKPQNKQQKNDKYQINNESLPRSEPTSFSSLISKPQISTKHQKQLTQQHQPQHQLNQQIKNKTLVLAQQKNKIKQKPCLNLKLIKDQIKNEVLENKDQNNGELMVKNKNVSKINVLEKRDGVFTAKLFKDSNIFNKQLSFGNFNRNKKQEDQFKQLVVQQKQDKTPKISKMSKIEQKNTKTMNLRPTQKLTSSDVFQKDILSQPTSPKQQKYQINYQLYETELQTLFSQMQQTKKKYLKSDQSYKDIFLLLNKANIIMNQRFISGTQTQTQKTTDDKNKEK